MKSPTVHRLVGVADVADVVDVVGFRWCASVASVARVVVVIGAIGLIGVGVNAADAVGTPSLPTPKWVCLETLNTQRDSSKMRD